MSDAREIAEDVKALLGRGGYTRQAMRTDLGFLATAYLELVDKLGDYQASEAELVSKPLKARIAELEAELADMASARTAHAIGSALDERTRYREALERIAEFRDPDIADFARTALEEGEDE